PAGCKTRPARGRRSAPAGGRARSWRHRVGAAERVVRMMSSLKDRELGILHVGCPVICAAAGPRIAETHGLAAVEFDDVLPLLAQPTTERPLAEHDGAPDRQPI